jgi:hypothetical protein
MRVTRARLDNHWVSYYALHMTTKYEDMIHAKLIHTVTRKPVVNKHGRNSADLVSVPRQNDKVVFNGEVWVVTDVVFEDCETEVQLYVTESMFDPA